MSNRTARMYVVVIEDSKARTTASIHATAEAAAGEVNDYVDENWKDVIGEPLPEGDDVHRDTLNSEYFHATGEGGQIVEIELTEDEFAALLAEASRNREREDTRCVSV